MIERFHKTKIPILSCLDNMKYKKDLSTIDWFSMEQCVKVLQTFHQFTKVISSGKSIPLSKMGILLIILEQKRNLLEKKLISILIQDLLERGKPHLENKLVNQAMLLHPRMWDYSFENHRDRYEHTYQSLIDVKVPFKVNHSSEEDPIIQQTFTEPRYDFFQWFQIKKNELDII